MSLAAISILRTRFPAGLVGQLPSMTQMKEVGIGFAAVVTLFGVWLCWQATHDRMDVEEEAKDGKLTEDQARHKMRQITWVGPAVVLIGMVALCFILL